MTNLFLKMAKIIVLSLFVATAALVILYFIIYKQLIVDQIDKAKTATDSLIVMKYSQMLYKNSFADIIKIYSKKTNIDFKIHALLDDKFLPFDKQFINKLKKKKELYEIKKDTLIYYRPLIVESECIRCHGGLKRNHYTGFRLGDFIGVLEARLPIKNQIQKYNQTFMWIFIVLGIALVFTLYYFYDYMKTIREDINIILMYFKNKIEKGIYEPLKTKMKYIEFEKLKKEINTAVKSIVYYRNEMIKSYLISDLTKLPNRIKLNEDLKKEKFNLAILNINNFREINDYFGQEIGDKLIYFIGQRIKNLTKAYHINIDEFAVPLPYSKKEDNFKFIANILQELEKPYHINENEIILTFRCGMSKAKENLLTTADIALEYAKRRKEKCLCFCDIKDTIKEFEKNLKILNILVKAIKNNRIKVYYQPIVENKTKKIVKYEALVRIEDEKGNIYLPGSFLDIAKSANLYPEITKKVFKTALETFKDRKEIVSLNLDLEDFENEKIRNAVIDLIEKFPEPQRITIELLESENITESKTSIEFMRYLRDKGVKIFIDDFGSGYSNFSYLFNFEVNGFKIDGSLIKNILTDRKSQMIVETMVAFAKKGGMKIVAEYVETEEIYKKMCELDVDCSQGFYFGKPQEII
ncbi:diguanylate cyclase/phosphodiesterase [Nautilia profundicola AmH]|uniref:Diguanylate cyclase/phosphodiesterase n=1 Tax=Nautilia profundicola (strain ATCC BAA-1463 / DSM 18972 / AmH) TaxID=598659 RepID=B9L641_NAUPA|nr:EAL domain-containing protein [Nautilia profundicola]ACM93203.1 diguanylate cyclase/phosphodiesterase [Nautilia profundicola AmH]